jgi:hypothetical protein
MKQKILFAALMGVITTGVISFSLISFNRGFAAGFISSWIKSWIVAYVIVVPVIMLLGPKVQSFVAYLCRPKAVR